MTDMTRRDDPGVAARSSVVTADGLRDSLIMRHGPAMGAALYEIEIESRRKAADRLRGLRAHLAELNASIEQALQAHKIALVPYQARMDAAYATWLEACNAYEAERISGEAAVADLRNRSFELIRQINQPPAHFQNMVRNWSRPADYVEEPNLPPLPEVNGPR